MDITSFARLMVAVAEERTPSSVARAVVDGISLCPNVILARIWFVDAGDGGLRLAASAGNPADRGDDYTRLDGAFRRFPLGVGKIGRVGQSGEPLLLAGLSGYEPWIAERGWVLAERLRSFAAQPLVFRGEVLGVLAVFDRGILSQGENQWLRLLADLAAVGLANARAFEELTAALDARGPAGSTHARAPSGVLTRAELREKERASLSAALEACGGKVFGPGGAAELLGMKPTTLASRLAKLGLKKTASQVVQVTPG